LVEFSRIRHLQFRRRLAQRETRSSEVGNVVTAGV